MQNIDSYDFNGKKAIVRVDFNVPLDANFNITDDTRIRAAIPTLKKVLAGGGALIIMSHLGKPKGPAEKFSLQHIIRRIAAPLANATVPGLKLVDRIVGALFSALVGLVFVWIVFAIIAAIGETAAPAQDYLSSSAFAGLLYNNNPITILFTKIFGA